jgi:hypothetical protein
MPFRRVALVAAALVASVACRERPPPSGGDVFEGFPDEYPSLLITNPGTLVELERDGLSFGRVMGAADDTAKALAASPPYADMLRVLDADLDDLSATIPPGEVGPTHRYRVFDRRWLVSERAHFELVGVVNRIDFRFLAPPGCGQTRLVYRLAYEPAKRPVRRLPMTVNVVYENQGERCDELARAWLSLDDGPDLAPRLRRGPLANVVPGRFDRLEIDVQSLRENSQNATIDDHAEYILRSFRVERGRLAPDGLRNTPDVAMGEVEKEELRTWIADHVDAIDVGSAELPREFLATATKSVTPRGLSRPGNRPFKALFPDENATFAALSFAGRRVATSPSMLVRRLDEMSCEGCHQSRSVAGFHLLGEDRTAMTFDAMTLGISEHLRETLEWRHRFLVAAARGSAPDEPVPMAEHPGVAGGYGAHCTMVEEGASSDLPDWPCAEGLACRRNPVDGDRFGFCVESGAKHVGDPCQDVELVAARGPDGDAVNPHRPERCSVDEPDGSIEKRKCDANRRGFPGGMCTATCSAEGSRADDSVCARIPHFGFEHACFAPGVIVEQCLLDERNSVLELLRTCSRTQACRDDFVCARLPSLPPDQGACVPPYFLFQTRIDGPAIDR